MESMQRKGKLPETEEPKGWELSEKAQRRLANAQQESQRDQQLAQERLQIRMIEILDLGRPDDAPEGSVFDGKKTFLMPEDLPDTAKRALGIEVTPETDPKPGDNDSPIEAPQEPAEPATAKLRVLPAEVEPEECTDAEST